MVNWLVSNAEIWNDYKDEMTNEELKILKERLERQIESNKQILKELEKIL